MTGSSGVRRMQRWWRFRFRAGFGRTDLFQVKSKDRWKLDAMITWAFTHSIYPFVQITVDADFGSGSDSVQSFVGISFDIDSLFRQGNDK